ncbi:hypothetical protein QBC33DRAFT_521135 [Phialemonium atrogriseum]|uniref:Uncharacterized protein n=1 Tax=Phialemonium atrogriseum TaxID=1093897 RepID=A0AAJ0FL96_9PEZI|nr:uncharacterized protein QBC33DRAFT_521135 [Phialemonium atrogriseum]KAK1772406.1 hypothetical protein QBC33DRAFT_521135 [Phialemonium atrogriseum]
MVLLSTRGPLLPESTESLPWSRTSRSSFLLRYNAGLHNLTSGCSHRNRHFEVLLDPKVVETVISDNSRMGLMLRMKIKGRQMERAATPYDSGSSLAGSGYLGESGAILNKGAMGATMRYRGAPQDNGSGGGRWGNKGNGPDPHAPHQGRAPAPARPRPG